MRRGASVVVVRGRFAEAELAYARALEACGEREPALRARTLHSRAEIAITAGDTDAAIAHADTALALAEHEHDPGSAGRARLALGLAAQFTDPRAGRAELARAADLARAAGDDWTLVTIGQSTVLTYMYQHDHAGSIRANDEVAALAERVGDPSHVARRWFYPAWIATADGRFADARDALARMRAAVAGVGDPTVDAFSDIILGLLEAWEGEGERALSRLQPQLQRSIATGTRVVIPMLIAVTGFAELASGRCADARERLAGLVPLVDGRDAYGALWALTLLAEAQRVLGEDDAAVASAEDARAAGERIGNQLFATRAQLTLARLAARAGDWTEAQQHATAHLDACVAGGHATYLPACLDALAEIAVGHGDRYEAARLLAAAARARVEVGIVRYPAKPNTGPRSSGLHRTDASPRPSAATCTTVRPTIV